MPVNRKILVLIIYVLLVVSNKPCHAQRLLYSKNRYKQVYYEVGDIFSFRIKGERLKITRQITGFEDSVIVFQDMKINPKRITHLYVDVKTKNWYFMRFKWKRMFLYAGAGYFIVDVLNSGEVAKETLVISSTLVGAGLLARWLITDHIRIKGKRKLYITR